MTRPPIELKVLLGLATVAIFAISGCARPESNPVVSAFAIADVTIIDPRKATVTPHQTLVVRGERIVQIHAATTPPPPGTRVVDGRGRYLIPGLWDAHTHVSKTGRQSLALFLANGVTGVRDMGSNLEEVASWRRRIASGELAGPLILSSGPMLEAQSNIDRMAAEAGVEDFARQRLGVSSPQEGRAAVRRLAAAGVDQIKMRTSPDLATFVAISEEAAAQGLPFAAHPFGQASDMLTSGVDSLEHLLERPALERSATDRTAFYRAIRDSGVSVSNTLVNIPSLLTPYDRGRAILAARDGSGDSRRKYLCGYLLRDWAEQVEENRDAPFRQLLPELAQYARDLKELHGLGVPLLAGTDAGVMFVYPGFSLHDELELMVRQVGLAPMDVLRIATDGVPAYFDRRHELGAIEEGQVANLVMLDADPLLDIRNTRRISFVASAGRAFDRAALDRLLSEVEHDADGSCQGGSLAGR